MYYVRFPLLTLLLMSMRAPNKKQKQISLSLSCTAVLPKRNVRHPNLRFCSVSRCTHGSKTGDGCIRIHCLLGLVRRERPLPLCRIAHPSMEYSWSRPLRGEIRAQTGWFPFANRETAVYTIIIDLHL